MKKNIKRRKYGNGSTVKQYMSSPEEEIRLNDININKAKFAGATDPLAGGFDLAAALMGQFGADAFGALPKKGFGGKAGNVPIEVEGKEVGEFPNGEVVEFKGPSHEQGGIDVDVPAETELFSKRLKIDGKTLAQRKKIRTRKETSIQTQLKKNPGNQVLKNTLERVLTTNQKEEAKDMQLQEAFNDQQKQKANVEREKFAGGGTVDFDEKTGQKTVDNFTTDIDLSGGSNLKSLFDEFTKIEGLPSSGEALGLAGTLYSGIKPMLNTLESGANDTPNINAFENFGEDALLSIDQQKAFVKQQEAAQLRKADLSKNSASKTLQNSASSQSTLNALRLGLEEAGDKNRRDIFAQSSADMLRILGTEAEAKNQRDLRQMTGEQARDLADRQDADAFLSNLSQNQVGLGRSLQETSKNLGKIKVNNEKRNLINAHSVNFNIDRKGNITDKQGNPLSFEQVQTVKSLAEQAGLSVEDYLNNNPDLKI